MSTMEEYKEYFDVLNENGEKIGEPQPHQYVHQHGLFHRTVHVWFLNSQGEILLQRRSKNKWVYPNYWDISVGGHVSAGQTNLEAAKKETQEELGLILPDLIFKHLFTIKEHVVINNGVYINNEFQDVYLVRSDISISDLKLSSEEVEEVRWISIKDFELWAKGQGERLVPHPEEYSRLLKHLRGSIA